MKKIAFLLVFLGLFASFTAKAAVPDGTYFFQDNKGYDASGNQTFFCLGITSQTCYTEEGTFAFMRDLQAVVADTNAKVDLLNQKIDALQNTVNQLQQPIATGGVIAPSTPVPSDTTAPKLVGFALDKFTTSGTLQFFKKDTLQFQTDEPTTMTITVFPTNNMELKTVLTDSNLSTLHTFSYNDFNGQKGQSYGLIYTVTDASGNVDVKPEAYTFTGFGIY